jgi:hypothetical protein
MPTVVSKRKHEIEHEKWLKACEEATAKGEPLPPEPKKPYVRTKSQQIKEEREEVRSHGRDPIYAPLFDPRNRLAFPKDERYYRLWITDEPGQVQAALDTGFQFVTQEEIGWVGQNHGQEGAQMESRVVINAGRGGHADNTLCYLMQMPIGDWIPLRKHILSKRNDGLGDLRQNTKRIKQQKFNSNDDDADYGGHYGDVGVETNIREFKM